MATIEINDKTLEVQPGSMIIEAADAAGIYIPRFCYHKKLTIAANCRMCLVEVEKSGKPLPACATPVTDGMKVFTRSAKAVDAQKAVMEYLLINHPLDCPVCDQGGECELQDLSMGYGRDISFYTEPKRSVADEDLGPLIQTYMTRCIQCTRCVRFGQEIAGVRELGATGRGELMEITTYVKKSLTSELSGNIIDICPVGALTSKPFQFKARAWEMAQKPAIAAHDCIGSHVNVHTRRGKVMRVVSHTDELINEMWISDRDRFSYLGLNSLDRLTTPMIKQDEIWYPVDWETALSLAATKLLQIAKQHGPEQIAAWAAPTATLEEGYLLQKLMRGLGSHNIDHRLHQTDFADQTGAKLFPSLGVSLPEIENLQSILLIGSNVTREQPLVSHRIRKAVIQNNAAVCAVNPLNVNVNFPLMENAVVHPALLPNVLAGIVKAVMTVKADGVVPSSIQPLLAKITPSKSEQAIANQFIQEGAKAVFLGELALNHPQAANIKALAKLLAEQTGAVIGCLTAGPNSAGAWIAGVVPHREAAGALVTKPGLTITESIRAQLKAYILFNLEPELDCANPQDVTHALEQAEVVIAFSPFKSADLLRHADVLFPMAAFTENAGTYVNVMGDWQSFVPAVASVDEVQAGWEILCELALDLHLSGFDYESVAQVHKELHQLMTTANHEFAQTTELNMSLNEMGQQLTRITEWPLYRVDNLVRRSNQLQACAASEALACYMNEKTAKTHNLNINKMVTVKQGSGAITLPLMIDERIPDACVWIPAGWVETAVLGKSFGEIDIVECGGC